MCCTMTEMFWNTCPGVILLLCEHHGVETWIVQSTTAVRHAVLSHGGGGSGGITTNSWGMRSHHVTMATTSLSDRNGAAPWCSSIFWDRSPICSHHWPKHICLFVIYCLTPSIMGLECQSGAPVCLLIAASSGHTNVASLKYTPKILFWK